MVNNFNTAHFRGVAKALNTLTKGQGWTGKNFSPRELDEYRQAIYNKVYEQQHYKDLDIENKLKNVYNGDIPSDIGKYLSNNITYENYSPMYAFDEVGNVKRTPFTPGIKSSHILNQILFNPSYSAQMSVGSADFDIDKYGNVTLKDTYNVNKNTHLANKGLDAVHQLVKMVGKPYPININLGNINDWEFGYTGNPALGINPEPKELIKINRLIEDMYKQNELNKMRL